MPDIPVEYHNALDWLLEDDPANPGVRYLALRHLLGRPDADPEVAAARRAILDSGPGAATLAAQNPEGWWVEPGAPYYPKYTGTVWSVSLLAQMGADGADPRLRAAAGQVLTHNISKSGAFALGGRDSLAIHCLSGNLAAALLDLGWSGAERLAGALDWQARVVTGEGFGAPGDRTSPRRYYKSGASGPGFACGANEGQPCAWGAVKVLLAFGKLPEEARTPEIRRAIAAGIDFLLGADPATAAYPFPSYASKPSRSWFQFGFPVFYVTDVLQNLEALLAFVPGSDPRLRNALDLLRGKADATGRWKMEYSYKGKLWTDIEAKGRPSKWVTLRALRVLRAAGW